MLTHLVGAGSSSRPIIAKRPNRSAWEARSSHHAQHINDERRMYLVKRSSVIEATLPNFIHRTRRRRFVGTVGVRSDREYRPPTDTCLCTHQRDQGVEKGASKTDIASMGDATWCCLVNDTCPRPSSRIYLQSPLRLFARIFTTHGRVHEMRLVRNLCLNSLRYKRGAASYASQR